jgi:diacylglycerol O-acyltransferase / wax synthase
VNDVALAAVTSGYRALLDHRGELEPEVAVRTMVPVSLRTSAERGRTDNRVAAVFVDLPVAEPDPVRRLELISAATKDAKASGEQVATAALIGLTGVTPAMFVGLALRSVTGLVQRAGQRFVSTVTTNVPGPQEPWYLLGRRLLAAYPYVPIGAGLRTGIAIFSYDGRLTFGVTADYDTTPDVDMLAGGIKRGLVELAEAAGLDPADAISPAAPAPPAATPAAGNRGRASRRGTAAG